MKTHRSIAAMALAATMLASSIMPAAAAVQPVQVDNDLHITDEDWVQEADGYQGKTSVTFEVVNEGGGGEGPGPGPGGDEDPTIFSAYVPTVLPILMDLDGNVVAPTNAKVINGVEDRAIQVEGMEATEAAPDEKVFGFSLAGEDMTGDMASLPIRIEADGELDLDMQAEIPAQSEVRAESEIATVLFALDWADGSGEDVSSSLTVDWENGLLIPGSNKEAVFKWSSTDSNDKLVSVESSNPEIADVADIMTLSAGEYTGQLPVTVNAKSRGTTTITGELQSGETASFKVEVSEYNASGEPSVDIDGELNEGDTLEPGDITVNVPIITPDGEEDTMPVTPDELPSTELKPGDNEIELEVDVNGQTITIIIHINIVSSNPSNGLTQSIQEAQAMGFTFSSYEDGLQIDSFENLQFKSEINVPEQIGDFKVLKIGDDVFKDETNLTKITLPDTVTIIGSFAFGGCTNIKEIKLPDGVTSIGSLAFSDMPNLKYVNIPESCTTFGSLAWSEEAAPGNESSVLDIQSISLVEKDYSIRDKSPFSSWKGTIIIPEGVTKIGEDFLYNYSSAGSPVTSVILPSTVNSIGNSAFRSCYGATINLPESVQEVEPMSFTGVPCLEMSREQYDKWGFCGADGVTIDGAKGIELTADNMNLIGLTGEETTLDLTARFNGTDGHDYYVVNIGDDAFKNNNYLETLKIGGTVLYTGESSFEECQKLKSVTIVDGLATLGNYSFMNCSSLQEVSLPNSLTWIWNGVFHGCTSLADLVIPDSVTTIYSRAFYGIPHITYHGAAEGSPWGALSIN
ncbi:leucine-rich repeat domain-containing protein [Flavonifractor sp. An306]|uniref:leucine-rich repeat domain-containing protein n=1 Tax=Flavonifractor sp. An306 TaxID=1965629 RepID=UPI0013A6620B|nr:leucine-rich repeat domain-containing protein [Flavonifractor sp. An306]